MRGLVPGLVPRIHVFRAAAKVWMAGTSLDNPGHDEFWFQPIEYALTRPHWRVDEVLGLEPCGEPLACMVHARLHGVFRNAEDLRDLGNRLTVW
jgi:hypothetical protein